MNGGTGTVARRGAVAHAAQDLASALDEHLGGGLLICRGTFPRPVFFGFDLLFLRLERRLGSLHVLVQRLGFAHQFQNAVFGLADFLLAEFDFVLEGAILLVGFRAKHLVLQLGDFLILRLDVGFAFLALFLVGGERSSICLQFALMRNQFFLNFADVFGKGRDLPCQFRKTIIQILQTNHQLQIRGHFGH